MSSISSLELAVSASGSNEPECELSRSARSSLLHAGFSPSTGLMSPAMKMSDPSRHEASRQMEFPLMSSAEVSPAKTYQQQEKAQASTVNEVAYGRNTPELLANFDHVSSSWRTSQHCLVEGLTEFSETWPRSGMMQNGIAYQLPPLVRPTDAIGFGLWPTPVVPNGGRSVAHVNEWRGRTAYHNGKKVQVDLNQAVKRSMVPTPKLPSGGGQTVRTTAGGGIRKLEDWVSADLGRNTGALNPTWVEWLMGFPAEWTALKVSETPSSRRSRKSSDEQ